MNPAQFNKRIIFQKFQETEGENGFRQKEWVDFKPVWAMIKTVQGREFFQAAQLQAENIVRFVVRYAAGYSTDMRIDYQGRTFEIQSIINDDEMNKTLTIIGREVI